MAWVADRPDNSLRGFGIMVLWPKAGKMGDGEFLT
jgi:hypothetical protein